jgi:hypothetical protein
MSITRRDVLEALAAESDARADETTTVEALAAALVADERAVRAQLGGLEACELAAAHDGEVGITVTGEELLALDPDDVIVVDPTGET